MLVCVRLRRERLSLHKFNVAFSISTERFLNTVFFVIL
jgi:hypothetical protein